MANLTFQIPDSRMQDLIDAWGQGWPETVDGAPNPQTKAQFAKEQIRRMIVRRVKDHVTSQQPEFPIT